MLNLATNQTSRLVAIFAVITIVCMRPTFCLADPPCPGDLNGDYAINLADLAQLLSNYGTTSGASYEDGDLDEDEDVDLADLAALLGVYGTTCASPGNDCEDPIQATISDWEGYSDTNTTCGRGNSYENTCLEYFDGGEDIVYELTVPIAMGAQIMLDPVNTTWTGFALSESCPPGNSCLAVSTNNAANPHGIDAIWLDSGTYYIIIDTWPVPNCIPEFTLTITEAFLEWLPCPPEGIPENEQCGENTNGGCGMNPVQFEPIACGDTICGTIRAEDGVRDTDWFEIVVTEPTEFRWTAEAEFPVIIGLVETIPPGSGDCYDMTGSLDPWDTAGTFPDQAEITTGVLPPGTYWFWVSSQEFYDLPCNNLNDYVARLTCTD